jgi:amino acid permease
MILLYIPPVIIILGTFGNLFAFIILKNKAMLKFSTYFFLMVMAVADTLVLYIGLFPLWIGEMYVNPRDQTDWTCKLSNAIGSTVCI